MANDLRGEPTALTQMVRGDREGAKRHLRQLLLEEGGRVSRVALRVGVSRPWMWTTLYRLGMRGEPARARRAARERFRLPLSAA